MTNEPALISGAVLAVVNAGLALAVGFGLDVTPEQAALVVGFVNALLALVMAVVIRQKVTPLADGGMPADT